MTCHASRVTAVFNWVSSRPPFTLYCRQCLAFLIDSIFIGPSRHMTNGHRSRDEVMKLQLGWSIDEDQIRAPLLIGFCGNNRAWTVYNNRVFCLTIQNTFGSLPPKSETGGTFQGLCRWDSDFDRPALFYGWIHILMSSIPDDRLFSHSDRVKGKVVVITGPSLAFFNVKVSCNTSTLRTIID